MNLYVLNVEHIEHTDIVEQSLDLAATDKMVTTYLYQQMCHQLIAPTKRIGTAHNSYSRHNILDYVARVLSCYTFIYKMNEIIGVDR
jgi:hypothetical protein